MLKRGEIKLPATCSHDDIVHEVSAASRLQDEQLSLFHLIGPGDPQLFRSPCECSSFAESLVLHPAQGFDGQGNSVLHDSHPLRSWPRSPRIPVIPIELLLLYVFPDSCGAPVRQLTREMPNCDKNRARIHRRVWGHKKRTTQTISIGALSQIRWSNPLHADTRPVRSSGIATETQAGVCRIGRPEIPRCSI